MRSVKGGLRWSLAALGTACAIGTVAYLATLPDVRPLALHNPKTTEYIQLYVRKQLKKGKKPVVMMQWTPLRQISPHLQHAVVIAEDDMFYRHKGVDWESFRHALEYNVRKGKFARGASTITQQVARNLYLSPSKNPLRKVKEMLIAWKLERALTKDRILELYLNIAEWGVGVYGAQAASQIYFGKSASMIEVEEAVALAASLPSPWRLSPPKQGPKMAKRKEVLLARMRRAGYLPPEIAEVDIEVPDEIEGEVEGEPEAAPARPPEGAATPRQGP